MAAAVPAHSYLNIFFFEELFLHDLNELQCAMGCSESQEKGYLLNNNSLTVIFRFDLASTCISTPTRRCCPSNLFRH